MRIGLILVLANYLAFAAFAILRPPQAELLREKDAAWDRGEFSLSSADPHTYLAARPLYNWSEWHGGEHPAVKFVEVANLPALLAAAAVTPVVSTLARASFHYESSYIRATLFVLFATAQWIGIGIVWTSTRQRSRHTAA